MNSEIEHHDEQIDMFSKAEQRKALAIIYGVPLAIVIFVFIPWFVGSLTLLKWILF